MPNIETKSVSNKFLIKITGDLLLSNQKEPRLIFEDYAIEYLIACAHQKINPVFILDICAVDKTDAGGLAAMLKTDRKLKEVGGKVIIVGASEKVYTLIMVTGLNKIFTCYQTMEEMTKAENGLQ